jgi:sulfur-carrier protein
MQRKIDGSSPMPSVKFTNHLQRFFPGLKETMVDGTTVADVVAALDRQYPGLADYIVDERGSLRKHVNIFIGEELIHDREELSDAVDTSSRVFVFQALSGG